MELLFRRNISYVNFILFIILTALDKIMTAYALSIGFVELNPFLARLITNDNYLMILLSVFYIPLILAYFFIKFNEEKHKNFTLIIMTLLNLIYFITVIRNIFVLYGVI